MTKFSVTKHGKKLDKSLYSWDEETRTFSTNEHELVLNFGNISNCTIKTGYNCNFKTGSYCVFTTGSDCTFTTGAGCVFNTGPGCTFKTDKECVVIRRDIFEIIQLSEAIKIKLNSYLVKGFKVIKDS